MLKRIIVIVSLTNTSVQNSIVFIFVKSWVIPKDIRITKTENKPKKIICDNVSK